MRGEGRGRGGGVGEGGGGIEVRDLVNSITRP